MVNTRNKMYETNAKIKKYLEEKGFKFIYFFPHLRYIKDYVFENLEFDAIGWKENDKRCYLFQFKTNEPCPKKILKEYCKISNKYNVVMCWITKFDKRKLTKKHSKEIEEWSSDEKN